MSLSKRQLAIRRNCDTTNFRKIKIKNCDKAKLQHSLTNKTNIGLLFGKCGENLISIKYTYIFIFFIKLFL
jgi:hypothetical protein